MSSRNSHTTHVSIWNQSRAPTSLCRWRAPVNFGRRRRLFLLQSLPARLNLLLYSIQLNLSILFCIHISKAYNCLFISSFLVAHVCDSYNMTFHSIGFIIRFFWCLSSVPLRSSFDFENVSSPITHLPLISMTLWHILSVVIILTSQIPSLV